MQPIEQHWKIKVIDKAIEYYDGCLFCCEGMCSFLYRETSKLRVSVYESRWFLEYVHLFQPINGHGMFYWPHQEREGVQCRQIAIRLIREFVIEDLENEK